MSLKKYCITQHACKCFHQIHYLFTFHLFVCNWIYPFATLIDIAAFSETRRSLFVRTSIFFRRSSLFQVGSCRCKCNRRRRRRGLRSSRRRCCHWPRESCCSSRIKFEKWQSWPRVRESETRLYFLNMMLTSGFF